MFSNERGTPTCPSSAVYSAALNTPTPFVDVLPTPTPAEKSFVHSIPERSSLLNLIWLIESCLFRAANSASRFPGFSKPLYIPLLL